MSTSLLTCLMSTTLITAITRPVMPSPAALRSLSLLCPIFLLCTTARLTGSATFTPVNAVPAAIAKLSANAMRLINLYVVILNVLTSYRDGKEVSAWTLEGNRPEEKPLTLEEAAAMKVIDP